MYHRIPLSIEVRKVLKLLMYTLFGLLLMVSVYFFIKTSSTAESGYLLKENQVKKQELETENRLLKQKLLEIQAINGLKKDATIKDMAEPPPPEYVEPRGPLSRNRLK